MSKIQKIWLVVPSVLFLVIELLFGPLIGIIAKVLGFDALPLYQDSQYILDHLALFFIISLLQIALLLVLFISSVRYKLSPLAVISGIMFIFELVIILLSWQTNNMSF